MNNILLETTLVKQYHPLDVLKIIKDRIELIDSGLFSKDQNEIYFNDHFFSVKSEKETFNNSKINILIVDDNSDTRFTIGEIVTNLGYDPQFATDGYECLEKIKNSLPDLILLDIMMPKMDGFQTIREIRKDAKLNDIKVFALTAYAMLSDKDIIEKNGFNGLITKPVNTVQLERKLNQIFNVIIDEN
jgi:CheY-like chemotaxis protein